MEKELFWEMFVDTGDPMSFVIYERMTNGAQQAKNNPASGAGDAKPGCL